MRSIFSRLAGWGLAAVLATCVVIAAAMGLIAWHRPLEPLRPLSLPKPAESRPTTVELPERIGPARPARSLVDATFARIDQTRGQAGAAVDVLLEGPGEGLTVALVSATTGASPAAIEAREPRAKLRNVPPGSYWICVAPTGSVPRYSYVARERVELVGGAEAKVVLACGRSDVRVLLPAGAKPADLVITRADDPRWLAGAQDFAAPAASRPSTASAPAASAVVRGLGPGLYTATLRAKSVQFEVPKDTSVDLSGR